MPIMPPRKRLYVAYNHMPGGHVCVQHFDYLTRDRKVGDDRVETVVFTAEDQVKGFEKSDFVALNVNGTLIKNKVLLYTGPEITWDDPHAKKRVQEWAMEKGLAPYHAPGKAPKPDATQEASRVDSLEKRMDSIEKRTEENGSKIDQILEAVTAGKK